MSTISHTTTTTTTTTGTTPFGHDPRIVVPAPTTVVLVDPTADDGEQALDAIGDDIAHVSIVVLLSGPHSSALHDYARAEEIDLMTAAWYYLEQVEARIGRPGLTIENIVAGGPDLVAELELIAFERSVARIVVPPSAGRTARRRIDQLSDRIGVPVVVAEPVGTAG